MRHHLDLYIISLKHNLKSLYQYRFDFWVGLFSFIVMQIIGLFFIWTVYQLTPNLGSWSLNEVVFIYGLQEIVKSVYLVAFGNTTGLEQLIRRGNFDRFLIRPASPLFQLMISKINIKGIGSLIVSFGIFYSAVQRVGVDIDLLAGFHLLVFIIAGVSIYYSLSLITSTCAFWFTRTLRLHQLIFDFSEFTRYPIDIFHLGIQLVVSLVVPFALASYYPAKFFIQGGDNLSIILFVLAGSIAFLLLSYKFWNFGLKYYHSTGS